MLEINSQEDLLNKKQSDTWNPSLSIDMVNDVDLSSGWLNQPLWEICSSHWKSSPNFRGEKKHIWNHHLLIGNPYNGYINPYYWIDEFFPYGNSGSLDPIAQVDLYGQIIKSYQPRFPWNKTISWGVPLLPCHLVRSCEVAKGALNSMCHDHCESGWTSSGTSGKTGEEPFQRPQSLQG